MNRRSIFKLFAGAVMASAMEVCGLRETTSVVLDDFSFKAQMAQMLKNLQMNVVDIWESRNASDYFREAGHKIVSPMT